jgi:hypothetical protein
MHIWNFLLFLISSLFRSIPFFLPSKLSISPFSHYSLSPYSVIFSSLFSAPFSSFLFVLLRFHFFIYPLPHFPSWPPAYLHSLTSFLIYHFFPATLPFSRHPLSSFPIFTLCLCTFSNPLPPFFLSTLICFHFPTSSLIVPFYIDLLSFSQLYCFLIFPLHPLFFLCLPLFPLTSIPPFHSSAPSISLPFSQLFLSALSSLYPPLH